MQEALFLIRFAAWFLAAHLLYMAVPNAWLLDGVYPVMVELTRVTVDLLAPAQQAFADGNVLRSPRAALEIVRGCDGAGTLFLLVAAVLALPTGWKQRLLGVAAAAAVMIPLNQLRITALYFVVAHDPDWFVPAHNFVAPAIVVTVAAALFAVWSNWAAGARTRTAA